MNRLPANRAWRSWANLVALVPALLGDSLGESKVTVSVLTTMQLNNGRT